VATGIAAQVPLREDVVIILEKWDSLDALRAHLQAPHMREYRGRVKDLVARVQLQVLEPV
jgi:quinol monooxygenase YgiN